MTHTLRFRIADHGRFFATRHSARQIRESAVALLTETPYQDMLLDFAGVEAVSMAFADELVANLVASYGPRIVLADMTPGVAEAIEQALYRRMER